MSKITDGNLLRTPAHGIPLGELCQYDGKKYIHVKNDKRAEYYSIDELLNTLNTATYQDLPEPPQNKSRKRG